MRTRIFGGAELMHSADLEELRRARSRFDYLVQ